ncbi:RNA-binding domain-containing protein [Flavobacterium sp.]|jgi:predicted HTH transcriptional regulator|uniref:RNA-binding domain-containing protein n=1 Tax=Flavobacterium sp. TaxID=239 RepID=UPI0037C168B9
MDIVLKNLQIIERCINSNSYEEVETERFEVKDLSQGWGEDWYKSVCAFLNSNGGIIVIGINDKNNAKPQLYKFTGYDNSDKNEKHLKDVLPKKFTNREGAIIDVAQNLNFEIKDFMTGRIMIVYVTELDSEKKYAFYNNNPYIRKITGDHILNTRELDEYEEIKKERIATQELSLIKNTDINTINLDTLNNYIFQYNRGKKRGENLKKSLNEAKPFLTEQGFLFNKQVTLLGMLVCGSTPERFIQGKCQVDCYVINPNSSNLAESKEVIEDNIIELIKNSQSFVWRNIQVGVAYTNGGKAAPEYPEELIRECINNAIAHRSYASDRFIIIEIKPHDSLLIRNPGMFQNRQRINLNTSSGKIRRIKPFQVARNPKLTHLLKSFDYWEGKGKGLSSLIDACLENQIDVPYYILSEDEISLYIPKGKVYDDEMASWIDSFSGYLSSKLGRDLNDDEKIILSFFKKSEELNKLERYTILLTSNNNHSEIIALFEEKGLLFVNENSPELYPIYQVDKTLFKTNFNEELQAIFNENWDSLSDDYKKILNAIYLKSHYGVQSEIISANGIGNYLYLNQNKKISDGKAYDSYKRKVRKLFNDLEDQFFIVRKDGKLKTEGGKPNFIINHNFSSTTNLFSNI